MLLSYITENAEGKVRFLTNKLSKFYIDQDGQRLHHPWNKPLALIARDNRINYPDELARYIVSLDPTNGTYADWISNIIIKGQIRLPEDRERLSSAILIFNKYKNSRAVTQKDINKYSFRELENLCKEILSKTNESQPETVNQWNKWVLSQGSTKVFDDGVMSVIKFQKTGKQIEVFSSKTTNGLETNWLPTKIGPVSLYDEYVNKVKHRPEIHNVDLAAVALSRWTTGTNYCVANPLAASGYLTYSPVLAVLSNGEHTLLINGKQIKNSSDLQITRPGPRTSIYLSKLILEIPQELSRETIELIAKLLGKSLHYENKPKIKEYITKAINSILPKQAKIHKFD